MNSQYIGSVCLVCRIADVPESGEKLEKFFVQVDGEAVGIILVMTGGESISCFKSLQTHSVFELENMAYALHLTAQGRIRDRLVKSSGNLLGPTVRVASAIKISLSGVRMYASFSSLPSGKNWVEIVFIHSGKSTTGSFEVGDVLSFANGLLEAATILSRHVEWECKCDKK